jgi:Ankyrin repeat
LVDAGASLDIQDKRHKATPLMLAMRRHHSRVSLLLLHAGADLETQDWVRGVQNTPTFILQSDIMRE